MRSQSETYREETESLAKEEAEACTKAIDEALATLTTREQFVIRFRFGLNDERRCHTFDEIARYWHCHRSRIKQIEQKALRKLEHPKRLVILEVLRQKNFSK